MEITLGNWKAYANDERAAPGFTLMEATYLLHAATGLTRKEIAKATGRSPNTVRHGLERAYHKLNAYRVTAAVSEAIRRGWIAPLLIAMAVSALAPEIHMQRVRQPRTRTVTMTKLARREIAAAAGGAA